MYLGTMAAKYPERDAVVIGDGELVVSYAELDARSNQVAHALQDLGLHVGDTVAVMLENCVEFFDVWWAAMRSGLYFTPINWHLTAPEVEYLVADSEARVVIYSGHLGEILDAAVAPGSAAHLVAVGETSVERALDYGTVREAQPTTRVSDETDGSALFYSSGTTGRPKGIKRRLSGAAPDEKRSRMLWTAQRFGFEDGCRYLSPGPLYHAAPSLWSSSVHTVGGTAVIMQKFDPELALMLIDHQRITDSQWVPTMLHRMLRLPQEVRDRYDVSSLRHAWTAAAPISIELKRQMIDWWGDAMHEYYASSEGGGTIITAAEWLEHPGSVGRHYTGAKIYILDPETREEMPQGDEGVVYFTTAPGAEFEYHNDPAKTAESHHGDLFTAGDIGYLDQDDYLYLTDRQSNMIISGGMNIYPREIEEAIGSHPAVADVAAFGIPDEDLGEKVHAVIQPVDVDCDGDALIEVMKGHLEGRLARQKVPRSFEVTAQLPRDENGKLYKRRLRDAHR
jgi:long-chain acyl-CoA synthetase